MIMKIILTTALTGVLIYLMARVKRQPWIKLSAILGSVCGIFFVWNPEFSNELAAALGVGRGADMIFYSAIPIAGAFILGVYVRIQEQHEMITELVRNIAINDAEIGNER